jgi:proton-coupled amino acid transporter
MATYLTLMKGFVCSSALYLPKSFINGGWGFSVICLVASAFLTNLCASKVLRVRAELDAKSYTDIGEKLYGSWGKLVVNVALALS